MSKRKSISQAQPVNYGEIKDKLVKKEDWTRVFDWHLDGCGVVDAESLLKRHLSETYTNGEGGYLYLEPLSKEDIDEYVRWLTEIEENENNNEPLVKDFLASTLSTCAGNSTELLEYHVERVVNVGQLLMEDSRRLKKGGLVKVVYVVSKESKREIEELQGELEKTRRRLHNIEADRLYNNGL